MSEKKRVVDSSSSQPRSRSEIPDEQRCTHTYEDARRCRQPRWAGKEVCYQHDASVEKGPKLAGAGKRGSGFGPAELQELLAIILTQVMVGQMPVGRAYAIGFMARQILAAHAAAAKEKKLDVKHFWEVVELGTAFERAKELAKEREKEAEDPPSPRLRRTGAEEASFAPTSGAQDEGEAEGGGEEEN